MSIIDKTDRNKNDELYLYKISQEINNNYDTFDSAVVVAKDEEEAKHIHPYGHIFDYNDKTELWTWCVPEDVKVELLGIAKQNYSSGEVVCASFNAG